MNKLPATALFLLLTINTAAGAERVEESKSWSDSFPVTADKPVLKIENIWGDVNVRPGKPGEIVISVQERRSAPDRLQFERSLETLRLNTEADANGVYLYVGNRERDWHGRNDCRDCRADYHFDVTVPADTQVDVSTVNDGHIDIAGISGQVSAANVNGPIAAAGLRNCAVMNSVNGEVSLGFEASPADNCDIDTVNGDITLKLPEDSGLDVTIDLFNGRMLTQLPVDALALPATVEHVETGGRHQYRIEQQAGVRIGAGGPRFTISSLNGDIHIQKIN